MIEEPDVKYLVVRYIEMICIGVFVFGALWEGTIVMNLTTPQFLMVYGGCGALVSEVLSRLFKKKQSIKK